MEAFRSCYLASKLYFLKQTQFLLCLLRVPLLLCGSNGIFKKKARIAEPTKGIRIMRCELQGSIWKAYIFPRGKKLKEKASCPGNRDKHDHHIRARYKIR